MGLVNSERFLKLCCQLGYKVSNQTANELRLKTIRLIGRQNLELYKGWRGTEQDILNEYEHNKEIGKECNSWKNNVLIYDDAGLVYEAIKRLRVE
jgi:hypothetical protein